jgi:3-hydroxyacyl-CoA dehydrogenase
MLSVRQVPIVLRREIPGFVVNRLQVAVLSEAFRLVEDNVISVADLDHAIVDRSWIAMGVYGTVRDD